MLDMHIAATLLYLAVLLHRGWAFCCTAVVCRLSVCLSVIYVTPWYRFETAQHSELKFYRMASRVSALMMSNGVWKDGGPFQFPFRVDRDRKIGHIFDSIVRRKQRVTAVKSSVGLSVASIYIYILFIFILQESRALHILSYKRRK